MSSCASKTITVEIPKTEYVYHVPLKTERPDKPVFEKLNGNKSISEINNFKILQRNTIRTSSYIKDLVSVITFYETQIDEIQATKDAHEQQVPDTK